MTAAVPSRSFHQELVVIDALEVSNWDREVLEELLPVPIPLLRPTRSALDMYHRRAIVGCRIDTN